MKAKEVFIIWRSEFVNGKLDFRMIWYICTSMKKAQIYLKNKVEINPEKTRFEENENNPELNRVFETTNEFSQGFICYSIDRQYMY